MGRRGQGPPDVGTVEVLGSWRPATAVIPSGPAGGGRARRLVALVAVVALVGVVAASWWLGPPASAPDGDRDWPRRSRPTAGDGRGAPPARFDQPVGHRVVVLTLTGLVLFAPDTGTHREVELGPIRSFGASPAVAPLGGGQVAVLLGDRSVGVVDVDGRSVRRIADDVHAVFPADEAGSTWIRRQRSTTSWELTRLDASGRPLSPPIQHVGVRPPRVVAGRPLDVAPGTPLVVGTGAGGHHIEVHERRSTLRSYSVLVVDRSTGRERWLRDLSHVPVLTPDGRWLLVGEPITNRLTAYDVATLRAQTVQAPESAGVTLDWDNLAVLPDPPVS